MDSNFRESLKHVLKNEGGYVNHPRDPGGCTNKGITIATYRRVSLGATCQDLKAIPDALVETLYKQDYWNSVSGDDLPPGIDLVVFDMAVNAGPKTAAKLLQRVVGVDDDGWIGPVTLRATLDRSDAGIALLSEYADARETYYRSLRHFSTFGKGWLNRVVASTKAARNLIDNLKTPLPSGQDTLAELLALVKQIGILATKLESERASS